MNKPLSCPTCGRFSSNCWSVPYLSDYGSDYGGTCSKCGPWSDGA